MEKKVNMAASMIIMIGMIFRIIMCIVHFTHIDDIGVANWIILLSRTLGENEIEIAKEFSKFWTYAPFQAIVTQKLVNINMGYHLNIFMGRVPSLVCNILFIIVIYRLVCQIASKQKDIILLIVCITSLAWENIIYSAQMEPYSIGILFGAVIVYSIINKFYDNWHKTFLTTILFSIACYAQYQIFILVFAVYISSFIYNVKNKKNLLRVIFTGAVNFISSVPLLIFLLTTGKLQEGINGWNIGKNAMFMYQNIADKRLLNKVGYTLKFFVNNVFLCFKYVFLADSFVYISNILTIALMIFACFGIYYIHKNKEYMLFAIFHDLLTIIMLFMIIMGKLTLGPSRHILFIEPVWIVLICFGIIQILSIPKLRPHCLRVVNIKICLIIILFIFSIPREMATRKNLISEKEIKNLIDIYEPCFVFAEHNLADLYLFEVPGYSNSSEPSGRGWLQNCSMGISPKYDDTIILMSKNHNIDYARMPDNAIQLQLEERLNYFNLNMEWSNLDNYTIVYKKEIETNAEVEYAREYYWNYPNGLFLYVLKYCENEMQ